MMSFDDLEGKGLFAQGLPRYTSYPPATAFAREVNAATQAAWLAALDPAKPVSVYLHIPFCERLCWFCACRTQGVRSAAPVEAYVDTLERELALVAQHLPEGIAMSHMHWGGGTPTILRPDLIARVAAAIDAVFARTPDYQLSVEIDPTLVDEPRIAALARAGMTRASIGVQDFDEGVQAAIGRRQSFQETLHCVETLRGAGIGSLNLDLVYGLPYQTKDSIADTLGRVETLWPDRIALFGYAHVPHMAKRQVLIPQAALLDDRARHGLFRSAAARIARMGLRQIGIDHFARPADSLAQADTDGTLRRNFQGYTVDGASAIIGLGASSISRFPQGYLQNEPQTGPYAKAIGAGRLPAVRGHAFATDDVLRARVIEMLMCRFAIDMAELVDDFSPVEVALLDFDGFAARFDGMIQSENAQLRILPQARDMVRLMAQYFDAYADTGATYSRAS